MDERLLSPWSQRTPIGLWQQILKYVSFVFQDYSTPLPTGQALVLETDRHLVSASAFIKKALFFHVVFTFCSWLFHKQQPIF